MKVLDLLKKDHKQVPFPWTPAKIKRAGLNPTMFLIELGRELEACEDIDSEGARAVLQAFGELELLI